MAMQSVRYRFAKCFWPNDLKFLFAGACGWVSNCREISGTLRRTTMRFFCLFLAAVLGTASAQTPQTPDPRSLVLVGDRFKPLTYDAMTPEQKTMIEHLLAGERRGATGPFNVLLRSP